MLETRKATMADVDLLAGVIARAFEGDPIWEFIFPDRDHLKRYKLYMAYELKHHYLKLDESWTTVEGVRGAALWAPPGKWKQTNLQNALSFPTVARAVGPRNIARVLRFAAAAERAHPPGEHYYLSTLGTDPSAQGTGVGSAVMAPVLQKCDEQGIGAYLESSKEKNIPFYNRHGFEVMRELEIPGGPSMWLMWREPRPE